MEHNVTAVCPFGSTVSAVGVDPGGGLCLKLVLEAAVSSFPGSVVGRGIQGLDTYVVCHGVAPGLCWLFHAVIPGLC